jgi:hypothetical protein
MKSIVSDPARAVTGFNLEVRTWGLDAVAARQQREALLFLSGYAPAVFDAVPDSIEHHDEDESEPFCGFCGERIGIFQSGPYWMHYRSEDPVGPFQIVDPGHDPVVTWRLATRTVAAL